MENFTELRNTPIHLTSSPILDLAWATTLYGKNLTELGNSPMRDLAWAISLCGFVFGICFFLVPETHKHRRWSVGDLLFSVPYYPFISLLAINSVFTLYDKDHFFDFVPSSYLCLLFYAAGNIIHIPVTFLKTQDLTFKFQLLLHHLLSITCYVNGLYTLSMHFYGTLDAICEISTIYLNFVFLFKEFNAPPLLQTVNGIILWITYLFLRIFLFPRWLYMFSTEIRNDDTIWDRLNWIEKWITPITTLILFILSSLWMISLTKGLVKNVKGMLKPKKKTM